LFKDLFENQRKKSGISSHTRSGQVSLKNKIEGIGKILVFGLKEIQGLSKGTHKEEHLKIRSEDWSQEQGLDYNFSCKFVV
jgi:hypothetical protein